MPIVIDNFISESERLSLRGQLPQLKDNAVRSDLIADIPVRLEQRIWQAMRDHSGGANGSLDAVHAGDATISVPARLARGSVPMHQDCFNPCDAAEIGFIGGYVGILYLEGEGSLVMDDGSGEHSIDAAPSRFVAFENGSCYHRFDAPEESSQRAMIGPMAMHPEGYLHRAHDFWNPDNWPVGGRPGDKPRYDVHKKMVLKLEYGANGYSLVGTEEGGENYRLDALDPDVSLGQVKVAMYEKVFGRCLGTPFRDCWDNAGNRSTIKFLGDDEKEIGDAEESKSLAELLGNFQMLTLTVEREPTFKVVATTMAGENVASVEANEDWLFQQVAQMLREQLREGGNENLPKFIHSDGTDITRSKKSVAETFDNCSSPSPPPH
eukprot:TRINITY_DN91618_c0_g1_i1.p1 TRINITY_DN91618_c0_g1~~TRINITY_DN91618_c0_g1_i1.p1  ORF type:complete len:379 (-),score=62.38 TRINITY_DN91618_c0_g1_i1:37-1173(-)